MTTVWIGDRGRIGLGFSFQRVVICVTVIISVEQLDNLLVLGLEKQSVGAIKKERRKKGKRKKHTQYKQSISMTIYTSYLGWLFIGQYNGGHRTADECPQ